MITAEAKRARVQHWRNAFPIYLKVCFRYSAPIGLAPLFAVILFPVWTLITRHRFLVSWEVLAYVAVMWGFFFLLMLLTAIGNDVYRNWNSQRPVVHYDPTLPWLVFMYVGTAGFTAAAFLSYQQGWYLSLLFGVMALGCLMAARKCF